MRVDLNADVGEGFATDDHLLAIVTSANVACGFHSGDESTMRAACETAAARGVVIGAHVSYRDRDGFGRRELTHDPATIEADVAEQIGALQSFADVAYVKPHGALFHRATTDAACAAAIARAMRARGVDMALTLPGSELERVGVTAVAEGYADRGYRDDGSLVPRGEPGDLLDADAAASQAVALVGRVRSLCVHGDTPGAVELARRVAAALRDAGVELAPFA